MKRTILSVLVGIAIGAACTGYLAFRVSPGELLAFMEGTRRANKVQPVPAAAQVQAIADIAEGEPTDRASVYRIASQSSEAELRSLIERIASAPAFASQHFALSVLFTRYAELNDSEAINTLLLVRERQQAEAMALAVLDVIGIDDFNIARILAALPDTDPMAFKVDAIAGLAETNPSAALQLALQTNSRVYRSHAVRRVARIWGRRDPQAALDSLSLIQDDALRRQMQSIATNEWGRTNPETLLAHFAGLTARDDINEFLQTGAMRNLAEMFPERMLEIGAELPAPFSSRVTAWTLGSWAREDPMTAYVYAETLPPGRNRRDILRQAATAYASQDPDAAWLWVNSLDSPDPMIVDGVLGGIAQQDPDLAIELALQQGFTGNSPWSISSVFMRIGYSSPERMPEFASSVLAIDDLRVRDQALQMMTSSWTRRDPKSAASWTITNVDALPEHMLRDLAHQLARENPVMATQYVNDLPLEFRATWVAAVARGYAEYDSEGALNWIAQYRGQGAYEPAVMSVAQATAEQDPVAAASLLTSLGTFPEGSRQVMRFVVGSWVRRDAPAARSYSLSLPRGEVRDGALAALIGNDEYAALDDRELNAAFSSDRARQEAILTVIYRVARNDAQEAQRLVDEQITYADLRQQVEQTLMQIGR